MLLEWRNDPVVRTNSFNNERVDPEDHAVWFARHLTDPATYHLIVETDDGVPIGQVRFDIAGESAELTISIAEEYRSRGYGRLALQAASIAVNRDRGVRVIEAYLLPENEVSRRMFENAGWDLTGYVWHWGTRAERRELRFPDT